MGRAYEVRKASIQKTGAAKAKLYSMYAREIYQAAKAGGVELESNSALKRLVDKAKKEQVPSDIINRAIDKVNSGVDETYIANNYELFGPAGSTLIVACLTDNVNRSVSSIKAAINKCHVKMGSQGSVSYMYDHLCIVSFKGHSEEDVLNALIEEDTDIEDIETENDEVIIYGKPTELFNIKEAITKSFKDITFDMDEITYIPKDKVTLTGEDLETFKKLLTMLDDIEVILIILTFISLIINALEYPNVIYGLSYDTMKLNNLLISTPFNILLWVDNCLIYLVSIFYIIDTLQAKKNVLLKLSFCLFSILTTITVSINIINLVASIFGVF